MDNRDRRQKIDIDAKGDFWNRCFTVHPLVIIGSREKDGNYNLAPKHMAMPLGFSDYFCFIGTPRKSTYQNVKREKVFTVSFPKPNQIVLSSLSASQREDDNSKPVINRIPTLPAEEIDGEFLKDAYLQLECELSEITGTFDEWELVVGKIVAAYVDETAMRTEAQGLEDGELLVKSPIPAYLHPNRFSIIEKSHVFPFPKDFKR